MTASSPMRRLFDWKIRGIRWIEIIGVVCVAALLCSVYLVKADAQRETARIAELETAIAEDARRVRLLRAEVARLESPARLEALSRSAGLAPVAPDRRVDERALGAVPPARPAPAPEILP